MTSQGQSGSTLYMVNHGISTAALFLIAGFLVSRRGTRAIAAYGGVQKVAPVLAGTFLVAGLATLSLPGLAPFISEFLVLIGTFTRYPVFAVCAASALVLSAIYILWMYQRMMGGPVTDGGGGEGEVPADGSEAGRRAGDADPVGVRRQGLQALTSQVVVAHRSGRLHLHAPVGHQGPRRGARTVLGGGEQPSQVVEECATPLICLAPDPSASR